MTFLKKEGEKEKLVRESQVVLRRSIALMRAVVKPAMCKVTEKMIVVCFLSASLGRLQPTTVRTEREDCSLTKAFLRP